MGNMQNCVYRFLNKENEVIYIGKAKSLFGRLQCHTHLDENCYKERVKIEYISFETEYEMDLAERYFIPKFNPKYNTVFKDKSIILSISEFDEKEWVTFVKEKKQKQQSLNNKAKNIHTQRYLAYIERMNCIEQLLRGKQEEEDRFIKQEASKQIICTSSGDIFENMYQVIDVYKNLNINSIIKRCSGEKTLLMTYHNKYYNEFVGFMYLCDYLKLKEDNKERYDMINNCIQETTRGVYCITTKTLYMNLRCAEKTTGISRGRIKRCCENKSYYAEIEDGLPLVWQWYDIYLEMKEDDINEKLNNAMNIAKRRRCI